ncbi:MAG: ATP-binding protein, partial [Planctomycetia bacterium]|nr:ATP-binding protein [Planctomycetia bacterium]
MPSKSSKSRVLSSGKLRIGDEWNAINIIARTQTHPLKAVCELAENALDAGAAEVVIIRRRTHHDVFLDVVDDGQGINRDADGLPDFFRIATHVCDSMKRQLAERERQGIHGEFGIGLLSFWGLGENLRIISAGADGRLYEMQLSRGARTYSIRPVRGQLSTGGTRVSVGPLLPATRSIVTGEKLQRYLSEELRDRIRNRQATVRILDRVAHKQFLVEPREFSGERLPLEPRWPTPCGDVLVELYFSSEGERAERGVAVCKDGTRVLRDIAELEQFQHSPWIERHMEGVLDFGALNLAPGTRSGIVPDERLVAFAEAVQAIEPEILKEIANREQAESARASRDILRQVHKAFVSALRDLPANEYLFFDLPDSRPGLGKPEGPADHRQPDGARIDPNGRQRQIAGSEESSEADQILLPLEAGPLAAVRITPRTARREPGAECRLSATARDAGGVALDAGVEFHWRVAEGAGTLHAIEGAGCVVSSAETGPVVVAVEAR